METLYVAERRAWRAWLRAHHRKTTEIWLVFYKKHTGKPSIGYDEAVEEALCYGWIDSVKKRIDDERYVYRFTPRKAGSVWSAANKARVRRLTATGRMTRDGLECVREARRRGVWENKPAAEIEFEMPDELERALAQSPPARRGFDGLPPSYRKQYVLWVASAKQAGTRARRAAEAVELLKQGRRLGLK
jgi:uncharacterized protein YdeI (YjbR/CyaY-like superfamily)